MVIIVYTLPDTETPPVFYTPVRLGSHRFVQASEYATSTGTVGDIADRAAIAIRMLLLK